MTFDVASATFNFSNPIYCSSSTFTWDAPPKTYRWPLTSACATFLEIVRSRKAKVPLAGHVLGDSGQCPVQAGLREPLDKATLLSILYIRREYATRTTKDEQDATAPASCQPGLHSCLKNSFRPWSVFSCPTCRSLDPQTPRKC